jgi:hypothetical protein
VKIHLNDAFDPIPLEALDIVIEFLDETLQPTHRLRDRHISPLAKRCLNDRYLLEDSRDSSVWVLDLQRKHRINGRTCYYSKQFRSQEELDGMLEIEYQDWVREMKDEGLWFGE